MSKMTTIEDALGVVVPVLDCDLRMQEEFGHRLGGRQRRERRIVAILCAWLLARGWRPVAVDDSEEEIEVKDANGAMEAIFAVDIARVIFANAAGAKHEVLLVGGNDYDLISDWTYSTGDRDGFNAAMDSLPEWEDFI